MSGADLQDTVLQVQVRLQRFKQVSAQQQGQALARHNGERDEVGPSCENCWTSGANRALEDASITEPVPLLLLDLRNELVEPQTGEDAPIVSIPAVSGNAATASQLLSTAGAGSYNWSGQAGQPTWLWGGNDGANFYVYNPSNFSVNYAGSAGSVPWTGVSGRPTAVAAFQYSGNVGDGIGGALTLNALVQVANDNTVRIYRNTNCNCDCNC